MYRNSKGENKTMRDSNEYDYSNSRHLGGISLGGFDSKEAAKPPTKAEVARFGYDGFIPQRYKTGSGENVWKIWENVPQEMKDAIIPANIRKDINIADSTSIQDAVKKILSVRGRLEKQTKDPVRKLDKYAVL
jgi:hypothetical protein